MRRLPEILSHKLGRRARSPLVVPRSLALRFRPNFRCDPPPFAATADADDVELEDAAAVGDCAMSDEANAGSVDPPLHGASNGANEVGGKTRKEGR